MLSFISGCVCRVVEHSIPSQRKEGRKEKGRNERLSACIVTGRQAGREEEEKMAKNGAKKEVYYHTTCKGSLSTTVSIVQYSTSKWIPLFCS